MELKKGYKQTEVGVIPEDWEIELLENLSVRIGDGIHSTPIYDDSGEYFFVNGNNLIDGKICVDSSTKKVSFKEYKIHRRELSHSSILMSINGTIGNLAFYNYEKVVLGKSAAYININNRIQKHYLYYLLQTASIQQYFEDELTGSTIKNLGLTSIRNCPIPLPPLKEQTAIAEALSDADALIQSTEKLIAKKHLVKQAAMQQLLSPKEGWEVKRLGEIVNSLQLGGNYPNSETVTEYPLMKMGNIQRGVVSTQKIEYVTSAIVPSEKDRLYFGDLLFNTRNTLDLVGKVAVWRNELPVAYFNSNLMRIKFKPNFVSSNVFMNALFNSKKYIDKLKEIATGTTSVAAIYTRDLMNLEFVIPSLEEQTRIATILSDVDAEITALEVKLQKYRHIKQGMMQNLLTGKIRLV